MQLCWCRVSAHAERVSRGHAPSSTKRRSSGAAAFSFAKSNLPWAPSASAQGGRQAQGESKQQATQVGTAGTSRRLSIKQIIAACKLVCIAPTMHEHDLLAQLDGRAQLELIETEREQTGHRSGEAAEGTHEDGCNERRLTCTKGLSITPLLKKSKKQPVFDTPSSMPAFVKSLALLSYLRRLRGHQANQHKILGKRFVPSALCSLQISLSHRPTKI